MPLRGQVMVRAAGAGALPLSRQSCAEVEPKGSGARRLLPKLWFYFVLLAGLFCFGLARAEGSRMPQPNWEACRAMSGVAAILEEHPRPEHAVLEVPVNIAVYALEWSNAQKPLRVLTLPEGPRNSDVVSQEILDYVEQGIVSSSFRVFIDSPSIDPKLWPRISLTLAPPIHSMLPDNDIWFGRHLFLLYNKDGRVLVEETRGRYEFGCFDRRPSGAPVVWTPVREQPDIFWFAASRNDAADGTGIRISCRDIVPIMGAPLPHPTMSCNLYLTGPLHRIYVSIGSPSTEALVRGLRWLRAAFPNFWPPGYL
ncbi:MAG: hypothetical protein INF97_09005 [Roseomonas sp.]|nr:hypothetical protein [Roseomonas sp.]